MGPPNCQNQQSQRTRAAKLASDKPKRPTRSFWIRLKEEHLCSQHPDKTDRDGGRVEEDMK